MKNTFLATITIILLTTSLVAANKLIIKSGGKLDWCKETLSLSVSIAPPLDRRRGSSTLSIAKNRWKQQVYEALKSIPLSANKTADTCLSPTGSHLLDSEIRHALENAKINYYATGAIDFSSTLSLATINSVCGITTQAEQPNIEKSVIIAFKHRNLFTPALQLSFKQKEGDEKTTFQKTARYISPKQAKELIKTEKIQK